MRLARHGVFWSIVQSWGGKIVTFALSILLARVLSPEEFGIASSALLILLLVPMFAELGFGDAIMQRRDLHAAELNLPFYVSLGAIMVLFAVVALMSGQISTWLGVPDFSLYIVVISATMLITVPTVFQEAVYKRNMSFRFLAFRTFISHILGGVLAVTCAVSGFGIWSFVVQAYVVAIISFLCLWQKPQWNPGGTLDVPAFWQMFRFGMPILGQRFVDFVGNKFVDLLIITQFGIAVYGLYAVGSRLYVTLMQMVQGALYDVSLTVLSKIASDHQRIRDVYLKAVTSAASFSSPVFVLFAAVSPEICDVLFGDKWRGINHVAAPLLILGSVQCVQYMNGAFLSARGRPDITFVAVLVKSISPLVLLLLVPSTSVYDMVTLFVLGQLIAAPVSFYLVCRQLGLSFAQLLLSLAPAIVNGAACYIAVIVARPLIDTLELHDFWQGILLGMVYTLCWLTCLAVLDRPRLISSLGLLQRRGVLPTPLIHFFRSAREKHFHREWEKARDRITRRIPVTPSRHLLIFPSDPWTISGALGDDAMISATIQHFTQCNPALVVSVFCRPGHAEAVVKANGHRPIIIPERGSLVAGLEKIYFDTDVDDLVLLGADIMDGYYDPAGVADMLIAADLAARRGIRTRFLGFSFNQHPAPELAPIYDRISPEVLFNVRDEISLSRFRNFTTANADLVADVAFMLESGRVDAEAQAWIDQQRAQGRAVIAFNVHPMLIRNASGDQVKLIIRRCAVAMREASRDRNLAFLLLPHDYRNALGDASCLRPIYEALKTDPELQVYFLEGQHRAADIKALAGQMDGVVTGRMHLAIAALGMGVPTLCLTYQDKFEGLLSHFDLPSDLLPPPTVFEDERALEAAIVHFHDKLPALKQIVADQKPRVMRLASGNFERCDHEAV